MVTGLKCCFSQDILKYGVLIVVPCSLLSGCLGRCLYYFLRQTRRREEMEQPTVKSPLIQSSTQSSESCCKEVLWKSRGEFLVEVKKQLWLGGPIIASNLVQKLIQVVSVMFVGHLGELALSGASMATSFAGVTGFSLMLGMASALDTFCGQAFGAKQYYMLGIHMQRAILILTLACIPVAVVWAYTGKILMAIGQDPEISMEAGLYARWMIPSLFAYGLLQCQAKFLQCQSIVFPMMFSTGFTALLHILVCWVLVFKSGLGSKGAALANGISYWINALLLTLYIKLSPACKRTWTGFSREALSDVLNYIKLAIPSSVMVCLEFWAFESLVLLSGLLPNPTLETSVLSISFNTASMVFMIPYGLGANISTRVSNELGAGHPQAAQLAVKVVVSLAIVESLVVGFIMVFVRGIWGRAYSNEEEVVKYVAIMLPALAVSNLLDGIQSVLSGIARGCGWQKIAAYINLGAYYIVGIPCSVLFAFVFHGGGLGLWMGIICGLLVHVSLLLTITMCANWEKEVSKARDRVHSSTISLDVQT